ncbi:MAG: class I SAM-dependent methyltransferase [Terriglobia bacterium]
MVVHAVQVLSPRLRLSPAGLVVGCGAGDEVLYMQRAFASPRVFGLDVDSRFSPDARASRCVLRADALRLPFADNRFDFAAAFHSLEHVGDARQAIAEVWRAMRPGGWFYLGVPNRNRWLGYLGSFDATLRQKITWNLADWRARISGTFSNERGAHAGFGRRELSALLAERFTCIQLVTEEFLRFKYGARLPARVLNLLLSPRWIDHVAPSHYAICQKPRTL